ncbi:MAG: heme ABC transporter permease CcmC [Corticimicrobacter sp.]|uniref:heme ABC transporter permease CcmC n=1 Tax=Corticimicrobacter sp. TaxID=2678536 RepID=UPI0032DB2778
MTQTGPGDLQVDSPARRVRLFHFAAPQNFYSLAGRVAPWSAVLAMLLALVGLWLGFWVAPTDAQQGEVYRIIFIHVPAAWMSMLVYLAMAFWSVIGLAFNTRLSFVMSQALAPTGALFCVIALWTGALWGRPTWGAYWVWDARLTSQLLLLFLYLGHIALTRAIDDPRRADRTGALIALVGAVNVPIIYFSVSWWNTLHQGASVSLTRAPSMATTMLLGMLALTFAAWFYTIAVTLWRARSLVLVRERHAGWVTQMLDSRLAAASVVGNHAGDLKGGR